MLELKQILLPIQERDRICFIKKVSFSNEATLNFECLSIVECSTLFIPYLLNSTLAYFCLETNQNADKLNSRIITRNY